MNKIHKGTRKGFTLLEILLVIAAIGILAAIVLVAINPNRQIALVRDTARATDVNTIRKAIEQHNIDNGGQYPTSIPRGSYKDICSTGNKTATDTLDPTSLCDGKLDLRVLVPTYIASIPKDPTGGTYKVGINSSNNTISVWADNAEQRQIGLNIFSPPTATLLAAGAKRL